MQGASLYFVSRLGISAVNFTPELTVSSPALPYAGEEKAVFQFKMHSSQTTILLMVGHNVSQSKGNRATVRWMFQLCYGSLGS